jgi:hypothetical protein
MKLSRTMSLIASLALPTLASAEVSVWSTHGMDRVKRTDEPRPLLEPIIYAAKGEWEPLQVIATGTTEELAGLQIEASPLTQEDGSVIPAPIILREHYVAVTKPSELSPWPAAEYPDALVPLGFPEQAVEQQGVVNQPFWVDVYAPPGARAGLYEGKITVTTNQGERHTLDYTLQVWDFSLPKQPALKSSMFTVWRRLAEVHGFDRTASAPDLELQRILDEYYDMLVAHRMSPHEVWATYPAADDPISERSYEDIEHGLQHHLQKRGAGMVGLPLWENWPFNDPLVQDRQAAMAYVARYYSICRKLGCESRLYKIFGELDEPHTADAYAKVHAWKQFFTDVEREHSVHVPLLVTVQPTDGNEALKAVLGQADILSPHVSAIWADVHGTDAPGLTQQHLQRGGHLWAYTALVQPPEEWKVANGRPTALKEGNSPVWLTDFPAIHHRLLAWMAPRYGITGFTYWDTSHFPADGFNPWENAGTYPHTNNEVYNGDGFFIYPAHQEEHGFEGPVASIRLKWLRECVDDYDYLALMMQHGRQEEAMQRAASFVRGLCDWNDNLDALFAARIDIARHLERLARRKS